MWVVGISAADKQRFLGTQCGTEAGRRNAQLRLQLTERGCPEAVLPKKMHGIGEGRVTVELSGRPICAIAIACALRSILNGTKFIDKTSSPANISIDPVFRQARHPMSGRCSVLSCRRRASFARSGIATVYNSALQTHYF
jgi:hypothetical protein